MFFFESWHGIFRVIVTGICAYVPLIVLLRISGKRTLSQMNAFDLIITVALGSTFPRSCSIKGRRWRKVWRRCHY